MKLLRRFFVPLLALALFAPAPARAQSAAGPSFLIFRYASQSSLGMYSGYTAGPVIVVVGMLHNPRSSYREIMGAVGRRVAAANGNGVMIAPAIAYTNTGWYSQLYFVPDVRVGRLTVSGTLQLAQPLSERGSQAAYISPGNALFNVGGGISVGAAYYAGLERGSLPSHGAGPAIQRAVPHGSITLELVKGIAAASDEVRLTLRSSF